MKIYGTYLGNIYIYGIYKEYIRNIHKNLWYAIIWNTGAAFGGAPLGLCFCGFYIINIYVYSLYIPYIFHIYFLSMFHIFSLVCFLIYSVNSRSGHDQITTFGQIMNLLSKTCDFVKRSSICLVKHMWYYKKVINLLNKTHDFIKDVILVIKKERCNSWKNISAGLQ